MKFSFLPVVSFSMVNFLNQGLVLKGEPNLKLFNQLYWVVTLAIALCDKRGLSRGYNINLPLTDECVQVLIPEGVSV